MLGFTKQKLPTCTEIKSAIFELSNADLDKHRFNATL